MSGVFVLFWSMFPQLLVYVDISSQTGSFERWMGSFEMKSHIEAVLSVWPDSMYSSST